MKMNKKYLMTFGVLGLLSLVLVAGAVLTYYEKYTIDVEVTQPLSFSDNLVQDVNCNAGEVCPLGEAVTITNTGDVDRSVFITDVSSLGIDVSYVGKMQFTQKDLVTWVSIDGGATADIEYTITGDDFIVKGIPTGYTLIYYPNTGSWATDLANVIPLVEGANNIVSLPISVDMGDDYCNIGDPDFNPNAEVCKGAKLWLIPGTESEALTKLSTFNEASTYLFETDLITYTDSTTGEILVPALSTITIYPQFNVSTYITGGDKKVYLTIA